MVATAAQQGADAFSSLRVPFGTQCQCLFSCSCLCMYKVRKHNGAYLTDLSDVVDSGR